MPIDPDPSTSGSAASSGPDSATPSSTAHQILTDIQTELASAFTAIEWAEQEIAAAQHRHRAAADRIWHGFTLLRPTYDLMTTESVYRAHCRELLDRVARGSDTRPGTATECCIALCETSMRAPLTASATGLYARMWKTAGLPPVDLIDRSAHYEALDGALIDDHEQWLRARLRQDWRQLPPDAPALRTNGSHS